MHELAKQASEIQQSFECVEWQGIKISDMDERDIKLRDW
jgi:hypothetical protein